MSLRFSSVLIFILFLIQLNQVEAAEVESGTVALDQLVASARERSPALLAAKAEWLAAPKRVWIEAPLSDPTAGL